MISQASPLPTIGEMYAAALDHNRPDLFTTTAAMERAFEAYFLPLPEIALDDAVSACTAATTLWADVTGKRWSAGSADVAEYLTHKYQFIFAGSETDLQTQHSRTAPQASALGRPSL